MFAIGFDWSKQITLLKEAYLQLIVNGVNGMLENVQPLVVVEPEY